MTFEALAKQGHATIYDSLVASIGPKIQGNPERVYQRELLRLFAG